MSGRGSGRASTGRAAPRRGMPGYERRAAQRGDGVVERVVQRLRRRLALGRRIRQAILARARLPVERVAVALDQRLRILARRALEDAEDLIDLDGRVGLRDGKGAARVDRRRA